MTLRALGFALPAILVLLATVPAQAAALDGAGWPQSAGPVAIDSAGRSIVVAQDSVRGPIRVFIFDAENRGLGAFDQASTGPAGFDLPADVAVGHDDHIYLLNRDAAAAPIREYSRDGDFIRTIGACCDTDPPSALEAYPGGVLLLRSSGRVERFDTAGASDGSFETGIAARPIDPLHGALTFAHMAYSRARGTVLAVGDRDNVVHEVTLGGVPVRTWTFDDPSSQSWGEWPSISVDDDGSVYLSTPLWIRRYSSDGQLLTQADVGIQALDARAGYLAITAGLEGFDGRHEIGMPSVWFYPDGHRTVKQGEALTLIALSRMEFLGLGPHEWDLDGDGVFETLGKPSGMLSPDPLPTVSDETVRFPDAGRHTITVRVTSAFGKTATASTVVEVVPTAQSPAPPAPAPDSTGISIDGHAAYTDDRDVTVDLAWPQGSSSVTLSSRADLKGAKPRALASTVRYRLPARDGAHSVFARFSGSARTYKATIVLDRVRPLVRTASVHGRSLRVRATDDRSKVRGLQLTTSTRHPGKMRPFAGRMRIPAGARVLHVRVRDGAGNLSAWRTVRVPRR